MDKKAIRKIAGKVGFVWTGTRTLPDQNGASTSLLTFEDGRGGYLRVTLAEPYSPVFSGRVVKAESHVLAWTEKDFPAKWADLLDYLAHV